MPQGAVCLPGSAPDHYRIEYIAFTTEEKANRVLAGSAEEVV
jgi:hypothetical protein